MRWRIVHLLFNLLILFLLCACSTSTSSSSAQPGSGLASLPQIQLPPGFQISVYASGLHAPHFMTIAPGGVLLVADSGSNSIIALPPGTSVAHAGTPFVIASGLNSPSSLVMLNQYLYVSETSSIVRMVLGKDLKTGPVERVISGFPLLRRGRDKSGLYEANPTMQIGPDGELYVSVASDCNACVEKDAHRAAVWVYDPDGSHGRLFAKGLPNAADMVVNPWMGQIWADVNESDLMGTHTLPEAVYALFDQSDYGWPRCLGGTIRDPQFGQTADACKGVQTPLITMQAYSTAMGMAFYPLAARQFPEHYQNSLYIALHGSSNGSNAAGFKLVRLPLDCGRMKGPVEDFITGWLHSDGTSSGRPMGITFAPDGSMFISDDEAGLIYHVWYHA